LPHWLWRNYSANGVLWILSTKIARQCVPKGSDPALRPAGRGIFQGTLQKKEEAQSAS
jgi:hypothetical protein